jgi:NAD(P)-dependent dehydrogenase (short-subunit alcohol dehydrogenase family)
VKCAAEAFALAPRHPGRVTHDGLQVNGKKLQGKVAVVTGGNSGIGLGIAKRFAQEGALVYITGWRQAELDLAAAEVGHGAIAIRADISKLADIDALYEQIKSLSGHIDILALNAGIAEFMPFGQITEEHFDKIYNINVKGTLFSFQKALPILRDGASVIITGSIAGSIGIPAMSVYSSTKAALRNLVRGWIRDTQDRRLRINVLSPGHTSTPGFDAIIPGEALAGLIAAVPAGRLGTPADIAGAALFLASDDSAYVNGIELDVDGGVSQ